MQDAFCVWKVPHIKQNKAATIFTNRKVLKRRTRRQPAHLKHKNSRSCTFPQLDKSVKLFVQQARDHNVPLSGPIIQAKAKSLADALGIEEFEASIGWLTKFTAPPWNIIQKISGYLICQRLDLNENVLPGTHWNYAMTPTMPATKSGFFNYFFIKLSCFLHNLFQSKNHRSHFHWNFEFYSLIISLQRYFFRSHAISNKRKLTVLITSKIW
jgi:hypothetical protein